MGNNAVRNALPDAFRDQFGTLQPLAGAREPLHSTVFWYLKSQALSYVGAPERTNALTIAEARHG